MKRLKTDYIDLYAEIILLLNSPNVFSFKIYEDKTLCGVSSVKKIGDVYYVIIFNSVSPCLYNFVSYLVDFVPKGIIHFGASEHYGGGNAFTYKKNVSNNFIKVPYVFIGEEGEPPYFSISKNEWVF